MCRFARFLFPLAGALLAVTMATSFGAYAQEGTPAASTADCPATTPEENKALVQRYWAEVWTAGGEAAAPELLAPDELHHWGVGGDTVGPEDFSERLTTFLTAFPDFAIEVNQIVAEGDLVASHWTATGTQEGQWLGVPASGTTVEYTGSNFFRIECGLIAESWGEADHQNLLSQIGGLPDVATPVADSATP